MVDCKSEKMITQGLKLTTKKYNGRGKVVSSVIFICKCLTFFFLFYIIRLEFSDSFDLPHQVIGLLLQKLAEITGSRAYERYSASQIMKIAQTKPVAYANTEVSLLNSTILINY